MNLLPKNPSCQALSSKAAGSPGSARMRRIASAPASLYDIVRDVAHELQLEAMTHTPVLASGTCFAAGKFPVDILGEEVESPHMHKPPLHPADADNTTDADNAADAEAMAACLALPPDGECTRALIPFRFAEGEGGLTVDAAGRSSDTLDRWMRMWLRRRKRGLPPEASSNMR
jgi:hypothetical protein